MCDEKVKTWFLIFEVVPSKENLQYDVVEGALAQCWVIDMTAEGACHKAAFYVGKHDWMVSGLKVWPVESCREDFVKDALELEQYEKAERDGIAALFVAWARDGKTTAGPIELEPAHRVNIDSYLCRIRKGKKAGGCLHYEGGERCKGVIDAHSIQRQGILAALAVDGHVYQVTGDLGTLRRNRGRLSCKKVGIQRISTFRGFCEKHDNELFESIDKHPLVPTDEQAFLYAYRSVCRELFVKEYSLRAYEEQLRGCPYPGAIGGLLTDLRQGTALGVENLRRHKGAYDECLRNGVNPSPLSRPFLPSYKV